MEDFVKEKALARPAEEMTMATTAKKGPWQNRKSTWRSLQEATVVWRSMVKIAGLMTMAKPVDWETEVEPKELETKVEP